jgi:hypothetical protein
MAPMQRTANVVPDMVEWARNNPGEAVAAGVSMSGVEPFSTAADIGLAGHDVYQAARRGDYGDAAIAGGTGLLSALVPFLGYGAIRAPQKRGLLGLENWDANGKTKPGRQVAEYIKQGLLDESDREAAKAFIHEVRGKQSTRREASWPSMTPDQSPLNSAQRLKVAKSGRAREAEQSAIVLAEQKWLDKALSSPIVGSWNKAGRDRFLRWGGSAEFRGYAEAEARKATLEAITREARKRGLGVRHTSTGRDGRATSRYIVFPDKQEVRVSNHELPDTPARSDRAFQGQGPRWSGDIVVSDWKTRGMDSYFAEMTEMVSD